METRVTVPKVPVCQFVVISLNTTLFKNIGYIMQNNTGLKTLDYNNKDKYKTKKTPFP